MSVRDTYALQFKMMQMNEKLKRDMEDALGTPQEQYERLERLIEAAGQPTAPSSVIPATPQTDHGGQNG